MTGTQTETEYSQHMKCRIIGDDEKGDASFEYDKIAFIQDNFTPNASLSIEIQNEALFKTDQYILLKHINTNTFKKFPNQFYDNLAIFLPQFDFFFFLAHVLYYIAVFVSDVVCFQSFPWFWIVAILTN